MTPEQQKALALARARRRRLEAQAPNDSVRIAEGVRAQSEAQGGRAAAERRAAELDQMAEDRMTLAGVPVPLRAVTSFAQGVPFVGEFTDELTGLMGGEEAAAAQRATQGAMERLYPKTSLGLQVAGGIAGAAPMLALGGGATATNWVARATTPAGAGLRAAGVGLVGGATEGAATFAGRADEAGEGTRLAAAGRGAAVGGTLGATLGVLAPMLGSGAANLARRIKRLDVRTIADELGISPSAARVVKGHLLNDDLDAAAAALARKGDDALLAEAGPATRQALDSAMQTGGEALSVARRRVDERIQGAATRWAQTLDDTLGTAQGGIKSATRDIGRRTSAARQAAYDFAYRQPTPMAGDAGQALEGVLARIDPRDFNAALREAEAAARDAGIRNLNLMASIDEAGNVVFTQPPSVQQLDYLARGLASVADAGTDAMTGKMSPGATRAANQARALRDVLKENVPGYRQALKLGGDTIQEREALRMGRRLLSETTTFEDVRTAMRDAPDAVKAAARQGLRENLDAIMGRARTTIADLEAGNLDFDTGTNQVAEAVAAIRNLTTRNNFQKMRAVMGSDAKRLFDELEKVGDALVLRSAVARGSATAIRTAGREAMRDEVAPGAIRQAAGELGEPLSALRPVTRAIAGTDGRTIGMEEQRRFAEIADALTRIRGPEAQRALQAVREAIAGQPLKDADAALIGRLVGGTAGLGAYRAGTQSLDPQPR